MRDDMREKPVEQKREKGITFYWSILIVFIVLTLISEYSYLKERDKTQLLIERFERIEEQATEEEDMLQMPISPQMVSDVLLVVQQYQINEIFSKEQDIHIKIFAPNRENMKALKKELEKKGYSCQLQQAEGSGEWENLVLAVRK